MSDNYSREAHIKMLSDVINRVASSHNTWSIATITSLVGSFTAIGLFDYAELKNWILIFIVLPLIVIQLFCIYLSFYYLRMERSYRNFQESVKDGKYSEYSMDYKAHQETWKQFLSNRNSNIVFVLIAITIIAIILDIFIPIAKIYF